MVSPSCFKPLKRAINISERHPGWLCRPGGKAEDLILALREADRRLNQGRSHPQSAGPLRFRDFGFQSVFSSPFLGWSHPLQIQNTEIGERHPIPTKHFDVLGKLCPLFRRILKLLSCILARTPAFSAIFEKVSKLLRCAEVNNFIIFVTCCLDVANICLVDVP